MTSPSEPLTRREANAFQVMAGKKPAPPSSSSWGTKKQRLLGIDVTRGLALLGMIAVHALFPFDEDFNPNWVTYVAMGNASAVFAVLAGVGLSLTTGRAAVPRSKAKPTAASIAGRAVAIGIIGLLLGYTEAEIAGVILPYYAVLFLLAIPLLFLRTRFLVLIGVFAAVAVPVLSHLVRPSLPEASLENHSFIYVLTHPVRMLSELLLTGAYPALPWMSYICAGLIVGRLTLSSAKVARRLLIFGVLLAVAAAMASWYLLGSLGGRAALRLAAQGLLDGDGNTVDDLLVFGFDGTTPTDSWWWLATSAPHAGTPLDLLHTIGIALAVLGAMLLLGHATASSLNRVIDVVTVPLAAAGSMTLTLYTASVVFMNSPLDRFSPMGGYVFQVMGVLFFAVAWKSVVRRGPLELAVAAAAGWARARVERETSRRPSDRDGRRGVESQVPTGADTSEQETFLWWDEPEDKSAGSSPHTRSPGRARHPRVVGQPEATGRCICGDGCEDEVKLHYLNCSRLKRARVRPTRH
jgi:uncharacterized membrane protein